METETPGALAELLPGYGTLIRLAVVLAGATLLHLVLRGALRRSRASGVRVLLQVTLPLWVLILTGVATWLGERGGLDASATPWLPAWNLLWVVVLAVRLLDALAGAFYERRAARFPLPPLLRRSLVAVVYLTAAIAVLKYSLNVDITPLLATSAILTMVIGLALQGVLGNLLAGFSVNLVRTVEVGDLIRIGEEEGIVVWTNWRETVIKTRDLDYVHIPNNVLASERITNFSKPDALHRHTVAVGTSYADAPADVMEAMLEAAREASLVKKTPPPVAVVTGFDDHAITYKLFFSSEDYWSKRKIESEVMRLLWYKFKRRGIEIPFPMGDQLIDDLMSTVQRRAARPVPDEDAVRRIDVLRASRFLARESGNADEPARLLDDEALRDLAGACRFVRYTAGEGLCKQGDVGEVCWVVVSGAITGSVDTSQVGGTRRLDFRTEPGDVFGEMSLFTGMPRTASGGFEEETELLEIPREAFAALLASREEIATELATLVASRNEENRAFLESVANLPADDLSASLDRGRILRRLRGLASWGRRLVGGG